MTDNTPSIQTDYADPATIDVNEVIANINQSWTFRRMHWDDTPSWPNVTVKALADEVRRLRRLIVLLDEVAPLDHDDIIRLYQRYADIDGMADAALRAFDSGPSGSPADQNDRSNREEA